MFKEDKEDYLEKKFFFLSSSPIVNESLKNHRSWELFYWEVFQGLKISYIRKKIDLVIYCVVLYKLFIHTISYTLVFVTNVQHGDSSKQYCIGKKKEAIWPILSMWTSDLMSMKIKCRTEFF